MIRSYKLLKTKDLELVQVAGGFQANASLVKLVPAGSDEDLITGS
jgi:hypothetical protein